MRGGPLGRARGRVARRGLAAGADDHSQHRIAVTDKSRTSEHKLLPDLPPPDFLLGGLSIAPQLAVGDGALGPWPALRKVFSVNREPRFRVHQPASML